MKILFSILTFLFIVSSVFSQQVGDLTIRNVVEKVDRVNLTRYVTDLTNFQSRFMMAENRFEVAEYLRDKFLSMGYTDVVLDTFQVRSEIGEPYFRTDFDTVTTQVNVIATLRGTETPDDIYIICGHYDSFCDDDNPFEVAPGADDNASGTACVLEAARAIKRASYQPKSTLRFICFAAEELGNFGDMGSIIYAKKAVDRGDNIKFVINNDMIGFTTHQLTEAAVNVAPNSYFQRIDQVINICQTYGGISYRGVGHAEGDLMGFSACGISGIYFEEADISDQLEFAYHSYMDKWYTLNYLYMTEVVKAATAVLVSMEDVLSSNDESDLATEFLLEQNYPNPFNPVTTISYAISDVEYTTLKIYDTLGREIETLESEIKFPGNYRVNFSGEDLTSGVYFYTLQSGVYRQTKKMILLK